MKILEEDGNLRENMGQKSLVIFKERYSFDAQMSRIRNIIYEVLHNPYPHKKRRILFDFKQRCKNSLLKTLKLVLNTENP